jgi:hypothetical protein
MRSTVQKAVNSLLLTTVLWVLERVRKRVVIRFSREGPLMNAGARHFPGEARAGSTQPSEKF